MNDEYNAFWLFLMKRNGTMNISLRKSSEPVTVEELEILTKCMIENYADHDPEMLCRLRRYIKHGKGERINQLKKEFYESVKENDRKGN